MIARAITISILTVATGILASFILEEMLNK